MKSKYISKTTNYNGSELHPLYSYINHKLAGDSIVAFKGKCQIHFNQMVDAEDLVAGAQIAGDEMLHFIIELFNQNLMTAVTLQRLLVSIAQNILNKKSNVLKKNPLVRSGDDLYFKSKSALSKLSISIASCSAVSSMIHFAVNITNEGTPVKTCSLNDFKIDPKDFADQLILEFKAEYQSILEATQKVKPL